MDWEGDVRSECLGVCRGKIWIKELSVQHKQFVNWFYYVNHPLHKCSPIEDHYESWCFFRAGLVDMSQSGKSCPWCTCDALLQKKIKKFVHFLLQKKEWQRLTKPLHRMFYQYAYSLYCFPYVSLGANKENLFNNQEFPLF